MESYKSTVRVRKDLFSFSEPSANSVQVGDGRMAQCQSLLFSQGCLKHKCSHAHVLSTIITVNVEKLGVF